MSRRPLAVTMGEPAGIGPELAAMAWKSVSDSANSAFYCLCDPAFLRARLKTAGIPAAVVEIATPDDAVDAFADGLPVLPLENPVLSGKAGAPDTADADAVLESIERAVSDVVAGRAGAVVTAPVQKETLYDAGFAFPGHTEFLGDLARRNGLPARPVMMIASDDLRVVPVTVHVPVSAVPGLLSTGLIVETGEIVAEELARKFGIAAPRIAVSGLNPHAGEGGRLGTEDSTVIAPAIERLRRAGVDGVGPLPADTMFHAEARTAYDAALCMYHDQALVPIKTIAFDRAVNVTLGLPFVRTSPDHGTALSLAGKGTARPASFIAAIRMAARMAAQTAARTADGVGGRIPAPAR